MKNLLYKELRLAVHPAFYLILLAGVLLLIPHWPYLIAMMYLFFIVVPNLFQLSKASNDIGFTVMLPVRKRDIVKARLCTIMLLECLQVVTAVPFALLNSRLYPAGNDMIDANIAFFALTLMMYGLFNGVYFPMFYKTGYKVGAPILAATCVAVLFAAVAETLVQVLPGAAYVLDGISAEALVRQIPVLALGIAIFALLNWLGYRGAAKRFENVDL